MNIKSIVPTIVGSVLIALCIVLIIQCGKDETTLKTTAGREAPLDGSEIIELPGDWDGIQDYTETPLTIEDL